MPKGHALACIIASVVTTITGIILVITASIFVKDTNYISVLWAEIYSLSIFSAVIGALAIIFSVGLIYVVNRQFPALTTLFSGLLILVAFLAVICGVLLITGRTDFREKSYNNTDRLFRNYSDSDTIISSKPILGELQETFKCCGVQEATDWANRFPDGVTTPDSCCKEVVANCGKKALVMKDNIYLRGCAEPIYIYLRNKYTTLIGMNFAIMILALISAILAIVFERFIRQQYQSM